MEPTFERVTFVVDHPGSTTPLAKRHRTKPGRVERFEVFYPGVRAGNAYTELNDPDEQERRFREQLGERGDDGYAYDADFVQRAAIRAAAAARGSASGVDRMVMALTGTDVHQGRHPVPAGPVALSAAPRPYTPAGPMGSG